MSFDLQQYNTQYLLNTRDNGEPINDAAEKYGVKIVQADVAEGEAYWKVIGVHHLLPRENFGNHHVFIEALDEDGKRLQNPFAWAGWTWNDRHPDQRADPIPLDKPGSEPAGNITMYFGQHVSVWMNGLKADSQDKSDRAEDFHTSHPDEPLPDGSILNGLGHHSFYVVFQRTRKRGEIFLKGTITGRVERGQGRKVRLLQGDQVVAEQELDTTLSFNFENLSLGTYKVMIVDTEISQDNILLDLRHRKAEINLAVPAPAQSAIFGQVQNGQGKLLLLVKEGNIIARFPLPQSGDYRFENLAEGTYSIQVFETNLKQENISVDGTNSREVNLTFPLTPQVEKRLNHYLLFGPPGSRGRQVNLLLTVDYILAFSVTAGFSLEEAKQARQVTIIGEGISPADQQTLLDSGSEVEVLSGDAYDLETKLNSRIRAGRAFGE